MSLSTSQNWAYSKEADPFSCKLLMTKWIFLQLLIGSITILPFRALAISGILVLAWTMAAIGLIGINSCNESKLRKGWRRHLRQLYSYLGLVVLWCAGFKVRFCGRQASRDEAPILIGAPHSSFLEALIITVCQSSPVSRIENKDALLISTCQKFNRTIFVDRTSPQSRAATAKMICSRALKNNDFAQLFIFPEGTNTNRKKLIKFKLGAFNPGLPVQPVIFRYEGYENCDSITWTFKQDHNYLFSVWLLITRPFNSIEVEFLPVYVPNEEEKVRPELYAKNVQLLMAEQLGLYASDDTYHQHYIEVVKKWEDSNQKSQKV